MLPPFLHTLDPSCVTDFSIRNIICILSNPTHRVIVKYANVSGGLDMVNFAAQFYFSYYYFFVSKR